MTHTLMELPFASDALAPSISAQTLAYHHGKHHATYVNNLNKLAEGTPYASMSLEEIVQKSEGALYNNAAQVYNHNFYFNGLSGEKTAPSATLLALLEKAFGSFEAFKMRFTQEALALFGSGWVWLSMDVSGHLYIESFSNAGNPLLSGRTPLMTCDVWEHAYYIDYRNGRGTYLEQWWALVNWEFVSKNVETA